ncbi:four helix bundle protein [Gracilimonas sediminicola]|uniref:four helix bundle protein n=1 Tax=Gracilimonas sediminicola TaxID=2952158 RepID=UPI0038D4759E
MTYSFEKLDVWKKSKDFAVKIYRVTQSFPKEEKFGLVSQLRRASISVSSNIAEGSSRTSGKDQGRFYTIAYSSTIEVLNQLMISKELQFLTVEAYNELRADIEHITAMINRLHNSATNT